MSLQKCNFNIVTKLKFKIYAYFRAIEVVSKPFHCHATNIWKHTVKIKNNYK